MWNASPLSDDVFTGGGVVEPVTLILTALAAGAAAGGKDAAASVVKDAYAGLKQLVAKRFTGKPSAEVALAEHEGDPATWQAPLTKALAEAQVGQDEQILAAARRLLELTDPDGTRAGKYTLIDARGAHHAQFGDHNRQINIGRRHLRRRQPAPAATVTTPPGPLDNPASHHFQRGNQNRQINGQPCTSRATTSTRAVYRHERVARAASPGR